MQVNQLHSILTDNKEGITLGGLQVKGRRNFKGGCHPGGLYLQVFRTLDMKGDLERGAPHPLSSFTLKGGSHKISKTTLNTINSILLKYNNVIIRINVYGQKLSDMARQLHHHIKGVFFKQIHGEVTNL